MNKDLSKITNVLLFKDGYFWLTILVYPGDGLDIDFEEGKEDSEPSIGYKIVPKEWDIHNGFEFASDAYSYLASLGTPKEDSEGYNYLGSDGTPDRR